MGFLWNIWILTERFQSSWSHPQRFVSFISILQHVLDLLLNPKYSHKFLGFTKWSRIISGFTNQYSSIPDFIQWSWRRNQFTEILKIVAAWQCKYVIGFFPLFSPAESPASSPCPWRLQSQSVPLWDPIILHGVVLPLEGGKFSTRESWSVVFVDLSSAMHCLGHQVYCPVFSTPQFTPNCHQDQTFHLPSIPIKGFTA